MMKKLKHKLFSLRDKIEKIKFHTTDKVIVITGKNKGHISTILEIRKGNEFVKVEGVNLQTHYKKDDGVNTGGISQAEGWIHISNISHVTEAGKATKVRVVKTEGKKQIFSRKTGEELRLNVTKASAKVQIEDKELRKEKEELQKTQFEGEKKTKEAGVIQKKGDGKKKGDK
jgi:large subunit ribosomal protein L24